VPFPTKTRSTLPGRQEAGAPGADAAAEGVETATGSIGSAGWLRLAGAAVRDAPPNSRRAAANAVHGRGVAAGLSPEPLVPRPPDGAVTGETVASAGEAFAGAEVRCAADCGPLEARVGDAAARAGALRLGVVG
jgi:hypothetical protein